MHHFQKLLTPVYDGVKISNKSFLGHRLPQLYIFKMVHCSSAQIDLLFTFCGMVK